ncbi:MAG: hypothetical protein AAFP13_11295 [Pseudomonadota bacterium]
MWKRLIAMTLTFGLAAHAPPALAQMRCGGHGDITGKLETVYAETRIGRGLQSPVSLFEVWRAPETGHWTILMTRPDGSACIVASGVAWIDDTPQDLPGETKVRR